MSCSRTQCSASGEARTTISWSRLKSSTLPLIHRAPYISKFWAYTAYIKGRVPRSWGREGYLWGSKWAEFSYCQIKSLDQTTDLIKLIICLLALIIYISVNNFSVMLGQVFLGWTSTEQQIKWLVQWHNTITPMVKQPFDPQSRLPTNWTPAICLLRVFSCKMMKDNYLCTCSLNLSDSSNNCILLWKHMQ